MANVTELTQEQKAMIPEWNEHWIKVGLSTEPVDWDKATQAITKVYEILGHPAPEFVLCDGPMDAYNKVCKVLPDLSSSDFQSGTLNGSMDADWVGMYKFYKDVLGVEDIENTDILADITTSCGMWTPYDTTCYIQKRPTIIRMDNDAEPPVLHCEDGPAISYEDGTEIYCWRGVTIPKEWVTDKENLKPETALTWENIEQRRAAAEIIGWHKVLDKLNAKVINADPDDEIGTLVEVDIPDIGKERFLRVKCGTGREFALPVPPELTTALDANAWTYGLEAKDFMPEVRT